MQSLDQKPAVAGAPARSAWSISLSVVPWFARAKPNLWQLRYNINVKCDSAGIIESNLWGGHICAYSQIPGR